MPVILNEIDKWQGKLTWELLSERLVKVLHEKSICRHTLIKYGTITDAYNLKKGRLRKSVEEEKTEDLTLKMALAEIETLKAKIQRLERKETLFHEQFVRWGENLRKMPGVDMKRLKEQLDRPLPEVNRIDN
jgi:fructosamine-3-kinase